LLLLEVKVELEWQDEMFIFEMAKFQIFFFGSIFCINSRFILLVAFLL